MSEEIRREGELNDQELEGVSGGVSPEALEKAFRCAAGEVCETCDRKRAGGCDHTNDLAVYMDAIKFIDGPYACPYNRG